MHNLPGIHPIVYNRIDHCVCHCKPIKSQKDVRYVFHFDNRFVMVVVYEVGVVGKPAHTKYHNYD